MLITLTTTHRPATDLGYLLEKHPAKFQTFALNFGPAHVFYPVATDERCTAALLLEIDPVGLVRGRRGGEGPTLGAYVNDRPYVAASFMSVAIAQVFGSALGGRSRERAELAATPIPVEATIAAVRCRGGEAMLRRLFEPLGYDVRVRGAPVDAGAPEWGPSAYFTVELRGVQRVSELLVPPVRADAGARRRQALLRRRGRGGQARRQGQGVAARASRARDGGRRAFLRYRGRLMRDAIERLMQDEESDPDERDERSAVKSRPSRSASA